MSSNYLSKFCPVGIKDLESYSLLKERYLETGAQAIVFFIYPFCDQQCTEYVLVKHRLEKDNIKTLFLQPSVHTGISGQMATRIEAFLEMMQEDLN